MERQEHYQRYYAQRCRDRCKDRYDPVCVSKLNRARLFWEEFVKREKSRVIIVTGNSRVGKTVALQNLEERYRGTNIYICYGDYGNAKQKMRAENGSYTTLLSRVQYVDYVLDQLIAIQCYERKCGFEVIMIVFDRFILAEPMYEWLGFCAKKQKSTNITRWPFFPQTCNAMTNIKAFVSGIEFDEQYLMNFLYMLENRVSWVVVVPITNDDCATTNQKTSKIECEKIYQPVEYVRVQRELFFALFAMCEDVVYLRHCLSDFSLNISQIELRVEQEIWLRRSKTDFKSIYRYTNVHLAYEQPKLLFDRLLDDKPLHISFCALGGIEGVGKTTAYVGDARRLLHDDGSIPDTDYTRCVCLADEYEYLRDDLLNQRSVLPLYVYFESLEMLYDQINKVDEKQRCIKFWKNSFHVDRTPSCYVVYALLKMGVDDMPKFMNDDNVSSMTAFMFQSFLRNGRFLFSGFDEEKWMTYDKEKTDETTVTDITFKPTNALENKFFKWLKNAADLYRKLSQSEKMCSQNDDDDGWILPMGKQKKCSCR